VGFSDFHDYTYFDGCAGCDGCAYPINSFIRSAIDDFAACDGCFGNTTFTGRCDPTEYHVLTVLSVVSIVTFASISSIEPF
jgi:hypothetical protein